MLTIDEIERHFQTFGHPSEPIEIRPGMTVINGEKFVNSILTLLQNNPGKTKAYGMYYDNLLKYYQIIKWNNK